MDDTTFRTVAQGTLLTSVITGLGVGAFETLKGRRPGILVMSSVLNSSVIAATFFSVREYAISPLLVSNLSWRQYEKRRSTRDAGAKSSPTEAPLSWSELRTYNLLDTGFSGALTAGFLNAWKRGRPGLVPGLCTGAFVCTVLQWTYNELGIARVKFVSRNQPSQAALAPPNLQRPSSPPLTSDNRPTEPPRPLSYKILSFLGFQRISDEEYLTKMKATRDRYLRQIEVLEREAEEKSREDSSESKDNS